MDGVLGSIVTIFTYIYVCCLFLSFFSLKFSEGSSQAIKNDNKANSFGDLEV